MKTGFKWKCFAAFVAVLIFGLFQVAVFAQATSSIKYSYVGAGIKFNLYRVGEISSYREVTLTEKFKGYSISLNDKEAAQTLAAYAQRDNIIPDATSITNSDYNVIFNGLDRGVYLITGESYTNNKKKYTALPALVSVLNDDENRNISIKGKYEVKDIITPGGGGGTPSEGTTEVSVLKVWKGGTVKSDVTVQLIRDGVVYDEAVLNSSNNWRKTWLGLSDSYSWTVVEKKVAEGYEVSIEKDGSVFIITNTYKPTVPESPDTPHKETITETTTMDEEIEVPETTVSPNTPEEPDDFDSPNNSSEEPDSDNPDLGNKSLSLGSPRDNQTPPDDEKGNVGNKLNRPNTPTDKPRSGENKLPQTGQLWWPVPVFACAGILFIIIGMGYRRKEDCYECK